jgi:hypothetical protein
MLSCVGQKQRNLHVLTWSNSSFPASLAWILYTSLFVIILSMGFLALSEALVCLLPLQLPGITSIMLPLSPTNDLLHQPQFGILANRLDIQMHSISKKPTKLTYARKVNKK